MPLQQSAFTTAAMTAALQETAVTYEDLADLEADFEDEELETIRDQARRTRRLYAKRQELISRLPNFWPLVIEQAPPDIDEYIQPSDSALLLNHLTNLSVTRFELDEENDAAGAGAGVEAGDPRSIAIRLDFSPNDVFEDGSLEKRFWQRRGRDGWTGLVSEPVAIRWKKGKDPTNGMLGLVCKIWEEEKKTKNKRKQRSGGGGPATTKNGTAGTKNPAKEEDDDDESEDRKLLRKKIQATGMGGVSFFAWFGYIGRPVSAEESRAAAAKERETRRLRSAGEPVPADDDDDDDDEAMVADGDDDDDNEDELEIFQGGDELAICIAEDLWPGALKYFTQAQETDALSDDDFESDNDNNDDEAGGDDQAPPSKKVKS